MSPPHSSLRPGALRFFPPQAVVLHHLRRCELEDGVAPLLREALRLASLDLSSQVGMLK